MRSLNTRSVFGIFIVSLLLNSCAEDSPAEVAADGDPSAVCGAVSGFPFYGKSTCYSIVESIPLAEGDIVVTPQDETSGVNREAVAITGDFYRWPNGDVPIEILPEVSNPDQIYSAIEEYHRTTPIRFRPKTDGDKDYISVIDIDPNLNIGGYSALGRRGGRQELGLNPVASNRGTVIHELGHALGLWHEQTREDRDQHVTINLSNVEPDFAFNFDKHVLDGDDIGLYDYDSIMHYPGWAFAIDYLIPTITTRDPSKQTSIGNRDGLSAGDTLGLYNLYGIRLETTEVTSAGAVIRWQLPFSASAYLDYGTSESSLSQRTTQVQETRLSSGLYEYRVTLTNLLGNRLYYYRVATPISGSYVNSAIQKFRTAQPPKISNARVVWENGPKSYTATWNVSEPSSCFPVVGLAGRDGLPVFFGGPTDYKSSHREIIPSETLARNSDYELSLLCFDAQADISVPVTVNFKTLHAAPFFTKLFHSETDTSINVAWVTDIPANVVIKYGRVTPDRTLNLVGGTKTSGDALILGLEPLTSYVVQIKATDPATGLVRSRTLRLSTTDKVEILSVMPIPPAPNLSSPVPEFEDYEVRASTTKPRGTRLFVELSSGGKTVYRYSMKPESAGSRNYRVKVPGKGSLLTVKSTKGGSASQMLAPQTSPGLGIRGKPSELQSTDF